MEISTAIVPLVAFASKFINDFLIKSPWFSLVNREDKGKKHVVAMVIAAILSFGVAYLTGSLNDVGTQEVVTVLFNAAMGYTGSVAIHEVEKNSRI